MKNIITEGIYLLDSGKPGNTTTIMVGVHGNEISGIDALNDIKNDLNIISGKVYLIFANLKAIEKNVRFTEKNLNRCFLKDNEGSTYEEKRSKEIIKILDKSDYLLDIHNTESYICSLEFLITIHVEYSKYFNVNKVVSHIDDIQKGGSEGYVDSLGKKGFCLECGSFNFGDKNKSKILAKESIINFLKVTKNINGNPKIYNDKKQIIKMDDMYITKTNNFKLSEDYEDFQELKKGYTIAFDGDEELITLKDSVIIFAHNRNEKGMEGFCIGHIIG